MNKQTEEFMSRLALPPKGWAEVGKPHPHESAQLHVTGEATYTDDIVELQGTLHAALGLSQKAHAKIRDIDLSKVKASPGVVAVLTAADIPGENQCGAIIKDDPVLADGLVQYVGQPIFIVVADSHDNARRGARCAVIDYEELEPILTPRAAHAAQSYVLPPMHLTRGAPAAALAQAPHKLKGQFDVGGQEQFYLEGQISYAIPKEGRGMHVYCSTQHPSEMQHHIAHVLHVASHDVLVECRRMGGGFGGKESQSALWACAAAVAAVRLRRPVKLRADRDDDMIVTGKRHCFAYDYEIGYDDNGRIVAARVDMVSRAGFSADLSGPVATRAVCHFDNAYYLSDVEIHAMCGKTNTQSNTAFRGFGGPQGAIAIEYIIDEIARNLGKDALEVRRANFYGKSDADGPDARNTTHYGQKVEDNVIHALVDELERTSDYQARRQAIAAFNVGNEVLKKGLALTPVKFGISFNVPHLNQAGSLVHVYTDGSVLVNHGGTEMGQGLNTKVAQVVANALGLPLERVRCTATDTSKIANTSATAASTGSDLNGKAAQDAALQIRARLAQVAAKRFNVEVADVRFADGLAIAGEQSLAFPDLVMLAYLQRVQLWSDGFYSTPRVHWDSKTMNGHPFFYYAYGAAVAEVVIDTLTGEWKLLQADLLYDAGESLNPAIDIGQVEGGFIQGMGWLTTEELWWNKDGKLMTHAPSTYKIPAISDCPAQLRTALFKNSNVSDTIHRSKATGEPPLLLPFSVLLAIRDAVSAVGGHRVNPPLRAPATSEAILDAVDAVRAAAATQ
ncbi:MULTISPECIES: xanthine dehydrogenase molybdopterin binding subunit [unclassified Herbaspirillum]|uniref:xanthine dehydrogenase molybdopterin binding subunit n=1 Tax=unclassified Herbaspirillum TaxID=2624150 RepID=UPI0011508850|nr:MULTISPECIES: xanthine dehydrogenase molybdopterin binding subunit [unclassified Herbaspirillum]MBB5391955.1 xanthine dehydrogenase large subunit [Herbaspirillum sp. SJZ102]TQK13415.1 xanthine dehydrogenase molybdenum binding subunit apoprotein [Herbaspirillum sp. SJZ130]TQK15419.1 xanthine dehydrogenase molybdenum binding subunit apoprotein [Herbaspirillum sp. SJZ106]